MSWKHIIFLIGIISVFLSCEKKNWDNPYDEQSSPDLDWAPFISSIKQEDESIVLEFGCSETNFDSYVIERSVDNGAFSKVASPAKTANSWTDSNITSGGKLYKYKLYCKAGNNFSNSVERSITPYLIPVIKIQIVQVTHIKASCKITIENDGGNTNLKTVAVCWSQYGSPNVNSDGYNNKIYNSDEDSYIIELTRLNPNTTYYLKGILWYGTSYIYSNEITIQTDKMIIVQTETFIDSRDGQEYPTIKINNQTWMAKNFSLKVNDGCWAYENKESLVAEYGRLYTWKKAKEICPAGWHLPTTNEWKDLIEYVGGQFAGVDRLRTTFGWWLGNGGTNGNNETGFSISPSGWHNINDDSFGHRYLRAFYWTATESGNAKADYFSFEYTGSYGVGSYDKSFGFSVRYIKD